MSQEEDDDVYGHDKSRSESAAAELFSVRKSGGKGVPKPPLPPRPPGVSTPPQTDRPFGAAPTKKSTDAIPSDYMQSLPESARAMLSKVTARNSGRDDAADIFGASLSNPLDADYSNLDFTSDDINLGALADELKALEKDPIAQDVLFKGVDLRVYSQSIEGDLRQVEIESINDYLKEANNLSNLYKEIRDCDTILEKMEQMLHGFQQDLSNISGEIKTVQAESLSMNLKLKNRKDVEFMLSKHIDDMVVSEQLTEYVANGEVNDTYLEHVLELHKKITNVSAMRQMDTKAADEVAPVLEKLKSKAVARIRRFLKESFDKFRKPQTNITVLQNSVLRKRSLMQFLNDHQPEVGQELVVNYVQLLSAHYLEQFKEYLKGLGELVLEGPNKKDLVGVEESRSFFARKDVKGKSSIFALGDRIQILSELDDVPMVLHIQTRAEVKMHYERVFRSAHSLLVDAACSEYLFTNDFFGQAGVFDMVFAKTIEHFETRMDKYLEECFDGVGLLLMIRITQHFRNEMQQRRVPCLDAYLDRLMMKLWLRFKMVMELNLESIRSAKFTVKEVQPTYVTRRYTELSMALLLLNIPFNDEIILSCLSQMRLECERLLMRQATDFSTRQMQAVFLINNYDHLLSILEEKDLKNSEEYRFFHDLQQTQQVCYVEEEVKKFFGSLVTFVKQTEPTILGGGDDKDALRARIDQQMCEAIVKEFSALWKDHIQSMAEDIMQCFPHLKCGSEVLQSVLAQMLLYYGRLLNIIRQCWKSPPFQKDIVNVPTISYEIKRYGQTFGESSTFIDMPKHVEAVVNPSRTVIEAGSVLNDNVEIWLLQAPSTFDFATLNGEKLRVADQAGEIGLVGDSKYLVSQVDSGEVTSVYAVLPRPSKSDFVSGKQFSRKLHISTAVSVPSLPLSDSLPQEDGQVKQWTGLRVRVRVPGAGLGRDIPIVTRSKRSASREPVHVERTSKKVKSVEKSKKKSKKSS